MKKFLTVLFMVFAVTAGSFSTASAADLLLGLRGGYFMWDPYLKDVNNQFQDMETGSGALYGPVASILLTDDLSLSFSGLIGKQSGGGVSQGVDRGGGSSQDIQFNFDVFRVDLDGALSYRLTDNFKLFAGYKYWYLDTKYESINYIYDGSNTVTETRHEEITMKQPFHGPAAGLGFSAPLGDKGYFFAMNVSGLYMWGKFKFDQSPADQYDLTYSPGSGQTLDLDMKMFGVMVEPTVGFNPGQDFPIVTLGLRYQYNKMKIIDAPAEMDMESGWITDKIYGIFIGALYQI